MRRARKNPLPPAIAVRGGPLKSVLTQWLRARPPTSPEMQAENYRRGFWAVGRILEDLYREAERRGGAHDAIEEALRTLQRWCKEEASLQNVYDDWQPLRELVRNREAFLQFPDGTRHVALALDDTLRGCVEQDEHWGTGGVRSVVRDVPGTVVRGHVALGEAEKVAELRVARLLRASLAEKE